MKSLRPLLSLGIALTAVHIAHAGPYDPPAGQPGSLAVSAADPALVAWATGWTNLVRGPQNISNPDLGFASFGHATNALGHADATPESPYTVVSLGDGGSITLTFDRPIVNGPGMDFVVFENAVTDFFLELGFVEVSSDGTNFFRFDAVSLTPTNSQIDTYGAVDATNVRNLAGKYLAGYGTPFDLEELRGVSPLLNVERVTHVRVKDAIGSIDPSHGSFDSLTNLVNDPWPTPFPTGGFDLDAIGVLNRLNAAEASVLVGTGAFRRENWEGTNGGFSLAIGFSNVLVAGNVQVSPYDGPALGTLPGTLLGAWNIDTGTLVFDSSGGAELTFRLAPSYVGDGSDLRILHFGTNGWEFLPVASVDLANNWITAGWTDSFSPFAVVAIPESASSFLLLGGALACLAFRWRRGVSYAP